MGAQVEPAIDFFLEGQNMLFGKQIDLKYMVKFIFNNGYECYDECTINVETPQDY